ncbi:MAG: SPOR domain-containing protein [Halioglobus sp.]|nr:SPOR domain-containing protein [Halioglobus sp.]
MTAKDLHFSFDSALAQARQADAAPRQAPPGLHARPDLAAVTPMYPPGKQRRKKAARGGGNRQWLAVAGIALLNMAFLVLAALWLTGNTYQVAGGGKDAAVDDGDLAPLLAELRANAHDNGVQMQELQAALQRQGQALAALRASLAQLQAAPASAEADTAAQAPKVQADGEHWHINLGSFDATQGALDLQQQLKAKGHTAHIRPETANGATTYHVLLEGFRDRDAADAAAQMIMEQTSLSGLWVWRGE